MKIKLIVFALSLSTSIASSVHAQSNIVTAKEVQAIEEQIDKELQSSKLDNKKRLIATLLAGREFYQYRFYDKSKKYYQKAMAVETKENKSEAYVNLIAIALVNKDKKEIKKSFESPRNILNKIQNITLKKLSITLLPSKVTCLVKVKKT